MIWKIIHRTVMYFIQSCIAEEQVSKYTNTLLAVSRTKCEFMTPSNSSTLYSIWLSKHTLN